MNMDQRKLSKFKKLIREVVNMIHMCPRDVVKTRLDLTDMALLQICWRLRSAAYDFIAIVTCRQDGDPRVVHC